MLATIRGVRIRGICATVPDNVCRFEDELKHFPFPEKSSRRLARVMGFNEHRISDPQTTPCDMATYTLNHLFQQEYLDKANMESMIVVAQMSDHIVPGNSKVIHGMAQLPEHLRCVDMFENCIGFISGLYAACCEIAAGGAKEVVVVTPDVGACGANKQDRNTYPLAGDATGVAIVCRGDNPEDVIHFVFRNDGSRRGALIVPAGGRRMPYSEETAKMYQDEMGNWRNLNSLHMDGTAVFQFVMESVPPLIGELCAYAQVDPKAIDYHLTHQPNRFMLQKLADLMNVPQERLFSNIVEHFGNSSPATIPVNVAYNLGARLLRERIFVCFSAFGAGLSLAAALCNLGPLDFCELIEHPGHGCLMPEHN